MHDGYARALWHLTEACLLVPDLDADDREAAARVREVLVPGADVWTASYPAEAQRAEDKKAALGALADDLARLPVPGGDAREWASRHIQAGIKLGKELAAQATADAQAQAKKPGDGAAVRAQLIRLLGEFRSTLSTEAAFKPSLAPAVTSAFALLDKLSTDRASSRGAKKRPKDAPDATPPATHDA